MTTVPATLAEALDRLARAEVLLVAVDFDGTLAPIAARPTDARVDAGALAALRSLAALPTTHAAILTGRPIADLRALVGAAGGIELVGCHGGEREGGELPSEVAELAARLQAELHAIAGDADGFLVEPKPTGAAFHYRNADPALAAAAIARIGDGPARLDGVRRTDGKMVVELSTATDDKGTALAALRAERGATRVLFTGDDVTDEHAFAILADGDVGVKVGGGVTRAGYRVEDVAAVRELLEGLVARRSPR